MIEVYAIREKGTEKYLPALKKGRMRIRGFSFTQPMEKEAPRLFHTKRSAENALTTWLQGHWEIHTSVSGMFGEDVDIYPAPTLVEGRKREAMEIVKFTLGESAGTQTCTRTHKCVVDSPCNGYPRIWTDVDAFGEWAASMWFSKNPESKEMGKRDLAIMGLGIGGEAGEVQERIKKDIRDHTPDREGILKELGDVIFYAVTIARYYGYKPSNILRANYEKLVSRRERGTERGSGDER